MWSFTLKAADWIAEKREYHCSAVFLFFSFLLSLELQPIGWGYTQGVSSIKSSGDILAWLYLINALNFS